MQGKFQSSCMINSLTKSGLQRRKHPQDPASCAGTRISFSPPDLGKEKRKARSFINLP